MKVTKISIRNILGIEDLEIQPGSITEIAGPNGAGKTSVLEALRAALGGGHDATLIRKGADKAQVVIELEDGVQIQRTITEKGSDLKLTHPTMGQISRKQGYLNELIDQLGMNPVDFLTAPKKRRVEILLESMPMTVGREQLVNATGRADMTFPSGHALEVIGAVAKLLYDDRTGVNRVAREKRANAAEMQRNLPDGVDDSWASREADIAAELKALRDATQSRISDRRRLADQNVMAIREKVAEEIRRIEFERDQKVAAELGDRDAELEQIRGEYEPANQALTERLAEAKAKAQAWRDAGKTREFIERQQAEAESLESEAEQLTRALSGLDNLKAELLSDLPIQGVEIVDGDLLVDGIPFDRVNESRRIRLAMEIAKLRAGSLGLVVVDGLERLDAKAYKAFKKEAAASGLQFVVTRVNDAEALTVSTEEVA